ncbi:unnamed protein product, partial [Tetraodon nigroviridis]
DILMSSSSYQRDALTPPRPPHIHSSSSSSPPSSSSPLKPNQVGQVVLYGVPIVSLVIDERERLCLAQISNTLLKNYSYNEIHNRRVALGITCVQCTPVQLEILRRAGAMPISSRRCGMITKREAERLCKSFLGENSPPKLPDNFAFDVTHECAWGLPCSRAKCIKCSFCNMYFSPNKFIFHSHRTPDAKYTQPDAANFNSWRRHLKLSDKVPADELVYAWEDVKAMRPESRRRLSGSSEERCGEHGERGASEGSAGADRLQEAAGAGVPRSERHFAISCLPYVVFLSFSHHFSVSVWPKLPIFFPCSDNFQDQMKRELAYREEMVQQLQMVRGNMDSLKRFCCY